MRRPLFIFAAALTVVAVVLLIWKRERRSETTLTDGSKVMLVEAFAGEHRNPQFEEKPWMKLLRRSPSSIQNKFPNYFARPNGGGRSWYNVPMDTNSLHVWLERWDAMNPRSGQQLEEYPIVITDRDGWAWFNHGLAEMRYPGTNRVDYLGYSFAGFPRWEEFLELQMFHSQSIGGQRAYNKLGALQIRNPAYAVSPAQWPTKPLPQTVAFGGVRVTLSALEFRRNWQKAPSDTNGTSPLVNLKMSIEDQRNGELLTNAWHEVNKSFFDNYGNNSHNGLPPRRAIDINAPPLQWRIVADLVGDHRSVAASNRFLTLSATPLPGAGERAPMESVILEVQGLKVWLAGLLGPGQAKYTNGILQTNYLPAPNYIGIGESSSSSTGAAGKELATVGLSSGSPHIAFGFEGRTDGLWFSVRALDESGQSQWLAQRGKASSRPNFVREYDRKQLLWFSCEGLDATRNWRFLLGLHRPKQVEFFIDRPEWDGKLQ